MNKYLLGFSTEDAAIQSEIEAWIERNLVLDFDGKLFVVKLATPEVKIINYLQELFENKGRFFLTKWTEPVGTHPPLLYRTPEHDGQ